LSEAEPLWAVVRSIASVPVPEQSGETVRQRPDGVVPVWVSKPSLTAALPGGGVVVAGGGGVVEVTGGGVVDVTGGGGVVEAGVVRGVVGVVVRVTGVDGPGDEAGPLQAAPFSWTLDGGGVADPLATKPMDASAPVASERFQAGALAVTVVPDWVTSAFQPLTRVVPDGSVKVIFQGFAAAPLLSTVTEPW
jgi:hypothetical protein